ncbi:MAG: MBOAT family O-acyltransferase [Saprospiraceae bacterium]
MDLLNLILVYTLLLVPICWLVPARWQVWTIVLGTMGFMAWKAPVSLLILLLTTASSYGLFKMGWNSTWATILILIQSIGLFVWYKSGIGQQFVGPADRLIPLGLSYYSFRQIHYAIECYKEKTPRHTFGEYICYLFFLPTILVGPINRFPAFLKDIRRRRWDSNLFSAGLERIIYGYAKIILLGNLLISKKMAEYIAPLEAQHLWLATYLNAIKSTLNTYFQFAGFSDIAIGLALLVGFKVMENFNYPLIAPNINEFWNRWHISLSSWCKDYVYIPVASITRQPIWGIIFTMLVIGLWHELSLKYIVWGTFHGIGIAVWHIYKRSKIATQLEKRLPFYDIFARLLTFHFVVLSFIIIKEESWSAVFDNFQILFFLN